MTTAWRLHPLNLGEWPAFEVSRFLEAKGIGTTMRAVAAGFLATDGDSVILIDTGLYDADRAARDHGHQVIGSGESALRAALAHHDLSPEDVTDVILTHLHWDHVGNLHLPSRARVHVQESELRYAADPLPLHRVAYDHDMPDPPPWQVARERMVLHRGDATIVDGVSLVHLPGHTPGSQGVLVRTDATTHLVAGDNVNLYANLQGSARVPWTPGPIYNNLHDYWASFERMSELSDSIIPSHDPLIFEAARAW